MRSKSTYGNIFLKILSLEKVVMAHKSQFELNPTQLNSERLKKVPAELITYLAFWKNNFRSRKQVCHGFKMGIGTPYSLCSSEWYKKKITTEENSK